MIMAAAGPVALVIGPRFHQNGVEYILPALLLAGVIQIILGLTGMTCLMRFIPHAVMTGFVNAPGSLIFVFLAQSCADCGAVCPDLTDRVVVAALAVTPARWRKKPQATAETVLPAREK